MPKKRKGELPSGNIRRKVYTHSEPVFDEHGNPVMDPKTGKQKKIPKYESITGSSAAEVNKRVAEIKADRKNFRKPANLTLYEAIDQYVTSSDALLSPATIRGYRTIQRNAFPDLMHVSLSDIDQNMLRDAMNKECKRPSKQNKNKPLSSKTVNNEYGLITAVLNIYAPGLDCTVKKPQVEHNQHELSTPDVIYNIVKGTDIELPVLLAMWLSFTESEILGLSKSKSISSDGNYITIKEVIVKDEHNKSVVKNKGKQPTRDRTLRLPEYIKILIDQVETDRLVTISGSALYKRFRRLVIKAGIPYMTFHDLRHVSASVMAMLNVPDKYAQERGGWKSDNIMKSVYQQTFSSQREEVDNRIDKYMCDIISGGSTELKKEKKYKCWLELFDREDDKASREAFEGFCEENFIKL